MHDDEKPQRPRDVLFVGPRVGDEDAGLGERPARHAVLRLREGEGGANLEVGQIGAAEEGKPVLGELIRLSPRAEGDRIFDVEVLAEGPRPERRRSGPAMVASHAYRDGWDRVFGAARGDDLPN